MSNWTVRRSYVVFLSASLLCVGCAEQDPLPDIPPPSARVTVESEFVGCYERIATGWSVRFAAPSETPRTFYLTNTLQGVVDLAGVTPRGVRQADAYRASGSWRLESLDTIHVAWATDFQGVAVTLRRGATDGVWRGRTVPFSDDGIVPLGDDVSVRRVSDQSCDFPP